MTTDLTTQQRGSHELQLTDEQRDLVKRTIAVGATDDELALFLAAAQRMGLDPLSRQVHAVKRYDSQQRREVMSIQVGIDGLRLVAERSGRYGGQEGPWWCGPDGEWREIWAADGPPVAAKVVVLLHGAGGLVRVPAVAHFREYVATKRDGKPTRMWEEKGALMWGQVLKLEAEGILPPLDEWGRVALVRDLCGSLSIAVENGRRIRRTAA